HKKLPWSLVADFGTRFLGKDGAGTELTFMAGVRYSFAAQTLDYQTKQMLFVQALIGGSHKKEDQEGITRLAGAIGAGWDFLPCPGSRTAFRLQVDRLLIDGPRSDYWRFSGGVAYRWPNEHHER